MVPLVVPFYMGKIDKLIQALENNPKGDWTIDDLKRIAHQYKFDYRQPGTSHVTFRTGKGHKLTVPAHKPIKPIYIRLFLELLKNEGIGRC